MSASMFFAGSLIFSLLYLAAPEAWLIDPFRFRDQAPQVLSDSIFVFFSALGSGRGRSYGRRSAEGQRRTNSVKFAERSHEASR